MTRILAVFMAASATCLLVDNSLQAGAKDGKVRWTHKKTGNCKALPPIVVPPGDAEKKKPGEVRLKITFKAKQLAEFVLIGDGDTDLDVFVQDSKGKIVAKDEDPPADKGGGSDICVCRWMPQVEEEFTIIIVNYGPVENVAQAACN